MKSCHLQFLSFAILLFVSRAACAKTPLGELAAVFPYNASRLLADPARNRVYAAVPDSNGVIVIDTTTLQAVSVVPTGLNPVDMAISSDGNTLYVANAGYVSNPGALAGAVGVLDLNTLTLRASYGLPGPASAIATGLDGRVYVTATSYGGQESIICQLDGATGTIQTTFTNFSDDSGRLQISPDGKTLFDAATEGEPGSLYSFDVSTPTPLAKQTLSHIDIGGKGMTLSHDGKYLGLTESIYSPDVIRTYTYLLSSTDLNTVVGSIPFDLGESPRTLAFSSDDSLLYQIRGTLNPMLGVFDTQTSTSLTEVPLPLLDALDYSDIYGSLVTDNSDSYLFLADSKQSGTRTTGVIFVLGTGRGTLKQPLPVLNVTAIVAGTPGVSSGQTGVTVFRMSGLSKKVTFTYTLKGTAQNGTDYVLLSGKKSIKAGRTSATILIDPIVQPVGTATKTVEVKLQPGTAYQLGTHKKATLELVTGD